MSDDRVPKKPAPTTRASWSRSDFISAAVAVTGTPNQILKDKKLAKSKQALAILQHTDLGTVLVAAALIEAELRELIATRLVAGYSEKEMFTDKDAVANDFARTSALAFALGVIDKDTHLLLRLVRRLRNKFAHDPGLLRFDAPDIADQADEFIRKLVPEANRETRAFDMRLALVLLAIRLEKARKDAEPPRPAAESQQ